MAYFYLALVVFGINLMPAFAPGTWSVLVFFKINSNLNSIALVVEGVLAAGLGHILLAHGARALRPKLSARYLGNLASAKNFLQDNRKIGFLTILLFVFAPLPSAQIFEAAGFADVALLPLTLAFMAGRSVGYSLSVAGATALKNHALGTVFIDSLKSPLGIGIQLLSLVGVYLLMRVDWSRIIHRK